MCSFDPMAAAIDWLDAYRAAAISIVDLYSVRATVECDCVRQKIISDRATLIRYWQRRFVEKPAGELEDLQPDRTRTVISYRVPGGIVQAILHFDANGKIEHSRCRPTAEVVPLRMARDPRVARLS